MEVKTINDLKNLKLTVRDLRDLKIHLNNIEEFKHVVQKAIEGENRHNKNNYWLSEKCDDNSNDEKTSFNSTVMCEMETLRDDIPGFSGNAYRKLWGVIVYNIYYYEDRKYVDSGGFIVNINDLDYDMIKILQSLKEVGEE